MGYNHDTQVIARKRWFEREEIRDAFRNSTKSKVTGKTVCPTHKRPVKYCECYKKLFSPIEYNGKLY